MIIIIKMYISSVLTSIIYNNYDEFRIFLESKKYADKIINYKDLSKNAKLGYNELYFYFLANLIILNIQNLIPVINMILSFYNISNIDDSKNNYKYVLSEMAKIVNELEHNDREEYYNILVDLINNHNLESNYYNIKKEISYDKLNEILKDNGYKMKERLYKGYTERTIKGHGKKLIYDADFKS